MNTPVTGHMPIGTLLKGGLYTRMIVIVVVLAATAITQVVWNLTLIAAMQGTAAAAQLYGKGRYLAESMVTRVSAFEEAETADRSRREAALRQIINDIDLRYELLRSGDSQRNLPPAEHPLVLQELETSEAIWHNEAKPRIERLLSASVDDGGALLADLRAIADRLVEQAGRTASVYQRIAEEEQRFAEWVQWGYLAVYAVIFIVVFSVLRRVFAELSALVGDLKGFSSQLLSGTSQQVAATQEQAAAMSQTNSTAEELDHTAEQTVELSRSVVETSRQVTEVGESGAERVSEAIEAMNLVQEQSERIANSILALSERAQSVGKIISVVGDIAEQTNILAINAGIEASRDQVAGSGFAAVAREIKDLASQSRNATADIRQILGEVQQSTSSAVMLMEEGAKRVGQAIETIDRSSEVIDSLLEVVKENARSATKISASINQQAIGTSQIRQAMTDINEATNQSVAAIKQVESTASMLSDLSDRLKRLLNG